MSLVALCPSFSLHMPYTLRHSTIIPLQDFVMCGDSWNGLKPGSFWLCYNGEEALQSLQSLGPDLCCSAASHYSERFATLLTPAFIPAQTPAASSCFRSILVSANHSGASRFQKCLNSG